MQWRGRVSCLMLIEVTALLGFLLKNCLLLDTQPEPAVLEIVQVRIDTNKNYRASSNKIGCFWRVILKLRKRFYFCE